MGHQSWLYEPIELQIFKQDVKNWTSAINTPSESNRSIETTTYSVLLSHPTTNLLSLPKQLTSHRVSYINKCSKLGGFNITGFQIMILKKFSLLQLWSCTFSSLFIVVFRCQYSWSTGKKYVKTSISSAHYIYIILKTNNSWALTI